MDGLAHLRHLQTHPPAAQMHDAGHRHTDMGQLFHGQLDVTLDMGLARSQDMGLAHSPTFFGNINGGPSSQPSALVEKVHRSRQTHTRSPHGSQSPRRSPRMHRMEYNPHDRAVVSSGWKTSDMMNLEYELEQLRSAAASLPDIEPDNLCSQSSSQPGFGSPRSPRSPAFLSDAMKAVAVAHGQSSPRGLMPSRGASSTCQGDVGPIQSSDSPNQAFEPEVTAGPSVELREAWAEIARLQRNLQTANDEISRLQDEKKAAEAAHSRDVAALASLLQQVTSEKAKVLSDQTGKTNKTGSSTTDDTWSANDSETGSERAGSLDHLITGLLQK